MNDALPIVADQLRIAAPCDRKWEDMPGDDSRRYCGDCRLFVYNVAELSPEELVEAIESSEGRFCGRLYTRADGTVLTEDCPVGLAARARRKVATAFAFASAMAAAAFGVLSGSPGRSGAFTATPFVTQTMGYTTGAMIVDAPAVTPAPPVTPQPAIEREAILGDIAIEPPAEMGKIEVQPSSVKLGRIRYQPPVDTNPAGR